jgi:phage antirepressor YoqD-like protein
MKFQMKKEANQLQVVEFSGQRVLTTAQMAEAYDTETKNIQMNFTNNKSRFVEGRDYFSLQGDTLRQFKRETNNIGFAINLNKLYLWTERGANRHCKILDTDKAWQQFDILEETYFKVKNGGFQIPQTYSEALLLAATQAKQIEEQQQQLEEQKPAVIFTDRCMQSENSVLVREVAKLACDEGFTIGEKKLYEKLREWGLIIKNKTEPTQKGINSGYFEVVERVIESAYGVKIAFTTRVTPKGQVFIVNKLMKECGE